MKLLSIESDTKTSKNTKYGYLTGIQYLSPYDSSGVNLCANAKNAKCHVACLVSSGRMVMAVDARLRRTKLYLTNQAEYFNQLTKEITAFIKRAERKGLTPLVRLNGTSDIRFENIGFYSEGVYYRNIMERFENECHSNH